MVGILALGDRLTFSQGVLKCKGGDMHLSYLVTSRIHAAMVLGVYLAGLLFLLFDGLLLFSLRIAFSCGPG